MIEYRSKWVPLVIAAAFSTALLIPMLMPSVQAKDALPAIGAVGFADTTGALSAGGMPAGLDPAVMAALHEQASAALRELQMASARPQ